MIHSQVRPPDREQSATRVAALGAPPAAVRQLAAAGQSWLGLCAQPPRPLISKGAKGGGAAGRIAPETPTLNERLAQLQFTPAPLEVALNAHLVQLCPAAGKSPPRGFVVTVHPGGSLPAPSSLCAPKLLRRSWRLTARAASTPPAQQPAASARRSSALRARFGLRPKSPGVGLSGGRAAPRVLYHFAVLLSRERMFYLRRLLAADISSAKAYSAVTASSLWFKSRCTLAILPPLLWYCSTL